MVVFVMSYYLHKYRLRSTKRQDESLSQQTHAKVKSRDLQRSFNDTGDVYFFEPLIILQFTDDLIT